MSKHSSQGLFFCLSFFVCGLGTGFAQLPPGVQIFHLFSSGAAGADPVSPVIQTPDGSLVGISFGVGQFTGTPGSLFKISPTGQFISLHTFPADGSQGSFNAIQDSPASILQASDQNFYGTFPSGGQIGAGTLFRVSPSGVYHQLHDFAGDGDQPLGPLAEAFDGNLYGIVAHGPGNSPGAIFRVGLDGSFNYAYIFQPGGISYPLNGLVLGPDGNLYGAVQTNLYRFDPSAGVVTGLGSVMNPYELGNFIPVIGFNNRAYFSDTTFGFCDCPNGAIVSLGLDGSDLEFDYFYQNAVATGNLTLAGDGKFYSASAYGAQSFGAVADLSEQTDSAFSLAGIGTALDVNLTQISNGYLAGATLGGGAGKPNAGTVFLWNAGAPKPAPTILGFRPLTAGVGQTVTVWGNFFIGSTAVSVNGVPASFKTAASGFVSFTVPAGAITGLISITNAGGSTISGDVLTIR